MSRISSFSFADKLHYDYPHIYAIFRNIYEYFQRIAALKYYIFRVVKIQNNKIVFSQFCGGDYADNPKYIAEELLKYKDKYRLIWLLRKGLSPTEIPDNIDVVRYGSIKMIYHLVTAKVWVDNSRKLSDTRKRKNQYYVQTWHGFGPKKLQTYCNAQYKAYLADSNRTDIYVSCCSMLSKFYREQFYFDGDVLEIGYPRYDIFIYGNKKEIHNKVCSILGIPACKRIILYAPTFRDDYSLGSSKLSYPEILQSLSQKFGGEWVILNRLHHMVSYLASNLVVDDKLFFDASYYPDMQELLLVADVLITDYSSCMFDFAVTRNPCFLYHPDEKEYNDTRGFCIPPEELPFPRAHTNEELQCLIETFDETEYRRSLDAYLEKIGFIEDGNASKAVVDWIEKKIEDDK